MPFAGKRRLVALVLAALSVPVLVLALAVFEVQTAFYDVEVNEPLDIPPDGARLLARGEFHGVRHGSAGEASVYRKPDGAFLLRLEPFRVDNGPALRLYLVALGDANDSESVAAAERIDLGELRGNVGPQTYALPRGYDPRFASVVVWCERFSVNFATAPLSPVPPMVSGG